MIDDEKFPEYFVDPESNEIFDSVELVKTAEEGIGLLKSRHWDTLLLDHDLGPDRMNGNDVLLFLEENVGKLPRRIYLITNNGSAGKKMMLGLQRLKDQGLIQKYGWLT